MTQPNLQELLQKYKEGKCSADEIRLLEDWISHASPGFESLSEPELAAELHTIEQRLPLSGKQRTLLPRLLAAASVLLCVFFGAYFITRRQSNPPQMAAIQKTRHDALPGGNKAILTLANGQKIILNNAAAGNLAIQSGVKITKAANNQVMYSATGATPTSTDNLLNTIETPIGGQYQVVLPDGTHVWLNAASSLRYPVTFTGSERKVELTGEAYFEVAHNKAMPFRVVSQQQTIEVLGTHFNIQAYPDEELIKTTLLQGSVKVKTGYNTMLLKPGQQARVGNATMSLAENVDTDEIIAWKNGKIQFTDADIKSIMRVLARWYDVDVVYAAGKISTNFSGSVSRSKNLSVVLKVLAATGDVHFKIDGRRVTVMP